MAETTIPPWHMWGSSSNAELQGSPLVSSSVETNQLARIEYRRPDTWSFLFVCKFLDILVASPVAIAVDFQLIIGVGRETVTLNPFIRFEFGAAELLPSVPVVKYATQAQSPPPSPFLFSPVTVNTTTEFPAQSISCNAIVFSEGSINAGNVAKFNVAAFFAPRTHIRPDWFKHDFTGAETRGR